MGKEQELVHSIRRNDVESFRKIITKFKSKSRKGNKKPSLHIIDHDGFIPLHHAALSGNGEIVMGLLEFSCDVNAKDKKGMTPLHLAAWAGKVEPALLLLDAGAETNLCSRSGATPLHLASEHGNYGVVERLVDHDCDPTVVNNQGETALDLACRFGHLEVVRILLNNSRGKCEKLLNPKEFQEKASPLHMAAKTGHFDVVRLLVESGADINQRGPTGTCLHEAALYGKTDVVKYLVEAGIDVNLKNREGQTALDMVTEFTKSGASSEIKHLLREASVEVVYAKAVKDYANITNDSFLTLRMGDIVLVLDRRKDGMWKGCVRDDHKERIGYFPSSVVQVLRSPRNSVKRSSSSSSEASKFSTLGTVSNSFEIVTVAPPSQPVAGKPRAPRMSSFRKKPPNRSQSEPDDRSSRVAPNNGEAARSAAERSRSVNEVDDSKKKLNYLDIMIVDNQNNKSGNPSSPKTKTEYADVWVPNSDGAEQMDGKNATTAPKKDVGRTNETQKSVRVNGSYARLGQQMLGKQGAEDKEKLRLELQRQQEERMRRQQEKIEQESKQQEQQQQQQQQQQKQSLTYNQEQQGVAIVNHGQQGAAIVNQGQQRSLSESQLPVNPVQKSRHYTMSSLVTHSPDLSPLPLKKRHSLSGERPSFDSGLKNDKKNRSSLRGDRRMTSPPPPPPPPPSCSTTPSPVSSDVSSQSTPRSPSPSLPPLPKPMDVSPLSPILLKKGVQSPTFFKQPVQIPTPKSPQPQAEESPPAVFKKPVRPPSPSFPPPPASFPPPPASLSDTTETTNVSNQLNVNPQVNRSPSPPLPPPPENLTSPSTSSVNDFPPPPQALMEASPKASPTHSPPRQMGDSLNLSDEEPHSEDRDSLPHPPPITPESTQPSTPGTLHPPTGSQSGYEDMTRLKGQWTKPEVQVDKKGYVLINPVKRSSSPESPVVEAPTPPKPLAISSKFYENFVPLKTRHYEVRKIPRHVPHEDAENAAEESSHLKSDVSQKPEKPCRHCYVNCEVSGQQQSSKEQNHECSGDCQNSKDDSNEKSTAGSLPVLRVPPVPQVPPDSSSDAPSSRKVEYDELYDWLAQSKLLAYMDNFAGAGFDLSAMAGLTPEDLSEMMITKTGHRKRLLSEAVKLPKPVITYENNVPSWLKSLGLSVYESHFMDGGFDDIEFLYDLTKEDLDAIGITKVGHQRKILMATKKLQQRGTTPWKPVV